MYKIAIALIAFLACSSIGRADSFNAQYERDRAETHVKNLPVKIDGEIYVYFTTYAMPETYKFLDGEVIAPRKNFDDIAGWLVNSLASFKSHPNIVKPKLVQDGKTKTLWFVAASDFGWRREDLQAIFKQQPYFLSPIVEGKNEAFIFRADWFLVHATDTTKQEDVQSKDIIYDILLYGLGNEPKDFNDFKKFWGIRTKSQSGTIVDAGDSGVSRHTRQLARGEADWGYVWVTKDVKSHVINIDTLRRRDFIEDLFAKEFDAQEGIVRNTKGLQSYWLNLGPSEKFKKANYADHTLVVDKTDKGGDFRVRTFKSCAICHAGGIIPYTNAVADFLKSNGRIFSDSKDVFNNLKAFYLRFQGEEVAADNKLYESAVKKATGLDPFAVSRKYDEIYRWYTDEKVTQEQAALEFGITKEELVEVIKMATSDLDRDNDTTYGRLSQLGKGKPIPRDVWDAVNGGVYIEFGLELYGEALYRSKTYLGYDEAFRIAKASGKPCCVLRGGGKERAASLFTKSQEKGWTFCVVAPHDRRFQIGARIYYP